MNPQHLPLQHILEKKKKKITPEELNKLKKRFRKPNSKQKKCGICRDYFEGRMKVLKRLIFQVSVEKEYGDYCALTTYVCQKCNKKYFTT